MGDSPTIWWVWSKVVRSKRFKWLPMKRKPGPKCYLLSSSNGSGDMRRENRKRELRERLGTAIWLQPTRWRSKVGIRLSSLGSPFFPLHLSFTTVSWQDAQRMREEHRWTEILGTAGHNEISSRWLPSEGLKSNGGSLHLNGSWILLSL